MTQRELHPVVERELANEPVRRLLILQQAEERRERNARRRIGLRKSYKRRIIISKIVGDRLVMYHATKGWRRELA